MEIRPRPRNYNCSKKWLPSCLSGEYSLEGYQRYSAIYSAKHFFFHFLSPRFFYFSHPPFYKVCFCCCCFSLPTITFLMVHLRLFSLERSTVGAFTVPEGRLFVRVDYSRELPHYSQSYFCNSQYVARKQQAYHVIDITGIIDPAEQVQKPTDTKNKRALNSSIESSKRWPTAYAK